MKKGNKNNLKDRYCKLCGGKINSLKKCNECGKQYFRFKFEYGLYFIIAILLITIACLVFLFVQKDEDLKQANADAINWQKKHENMTSMYATLEKRFDELDDGNSFIYVKAKLDFYDNNIVFVIDGYGKKYYTYDCVQELTNNKEYSFWAFNTDAAISKGYKKGTC